MKQIDHRAVSRRRFLQTCGYGMTWLAVSRMFPESLCATLDQPSRVVVARDRGLVRTRNLVNREIAERQLNRALQRLTGESADLRAWRSLFNPRERIGIKLSCLPGLPLSSSRGLVEAIVNGLTLAGVPSHNIIIWERTGRELKEAGFKLSAKDVRVMGTDGFADSGYSRNIEFAGQVGTCFSVIMEQVDALINVPVLKDHDIAGLSAGMKNFYGAIYNPNKYHGNRCSPYVADLSTHRFIRDKLRLVVVDATRMQLHNGPAFFSRYALDYGAIILGTDPVAVDATAWRILDTERVQAGMNPIAGDGRRPDYIDVACTHQLGHMEEKWIERMDI